MTHELDEAVTRLDGKTVTVSKIDATAGLACIQASLMIAVEAGANDKREYEVLATAERRLSAVLEVPSVLPLIEAAIND